MAHLAEPFILVQNCYPTSRVAIIDNSKRIKIKTYCTPIKLHERFVVSVVTALFLVARSQVLSASRGDSVERSARTHRSAGSDVLALLHFAPFLFWASARAEGERERARCLVQIQLTHTGARRTSLLNRAHLYGYIHLVRFYTAEKREKEKKEVPGVRGGGIIKTQHVSGGIPLLREREREAAGVGCKENEREKEEEWGNIWHFVCHNAFLTLKEELWGTFG